VPAFWLEQAYPFDAWRNMNLTDFLLQAGLPEKSSQPVPYGRCMPVHAVVIRAFATSSLYVRGSLFFGIIDAEVT
jgi:hypothetical protein